MSKAIETLTAPEQTTMRDSLGLGTAATAASTDFAAAAFSPLDLSPTAWWDGTDSARVLKTISGSVAAVAGETVERWTDKIGGANLDQTTAGARWTLSAGGILTPPVSGAAGMASSIAIDHRAMSVVFVFGARSFYNHQPAGLWLNTSNVSGAIMERGGGVIYGPTTTGAINNFDADGSLLAFCHGASTSVIYNDYSSVSLAVRTAGTSTITRLFDYAAGGNPSKIPVKHVLIFARQLTLAEVDQLRDWSAMTERETVLTALGDSISAGAIANTQLACFINQLAAAKGWTISNGAISGTVASSIVSSSATINTSYVSGKRNICTVHVGTNDMAANVDPATFLASLATIYSARKSFAADWDVAVCTLPPRNQTWSGGQDAAGYAADRATVNAALQAAAPGTYFDRLIDFESDSILGPDATADSTTWFNADKIHPNQNGHNRMAVIAGAAYP